MLVGEYVIRYYLILWQLLLQFIMYLHVLFEVGQDTHNIIRSRHEKQKH